MINGLDMCDFSPEIKQADHPKELMTAFALHDCIDGARPHELIAAAEIHTRTADEPNEYFSLNSLATQIADPVQRQALRARLQGEQ